VDFLSTSLNSGVLQVPNGPNPAPNQQFDDDQLAAYRQKAVFPPLNCHEIKTFAYPKQTCSRNHRLTFETRLGKNRVSAKSPFRLKKSRKTTFGSMGIKENHPLAH
jgi:hypothetical protein